MEFSERDEVKAKFKEYVRQIVNNPNLPEMVVNSSILLVVTIDLQEKFSHLTEKYVTDDAEILLSNSDTIKKILEYYSLVNAGTDAFVSELEKEE